MLSKLNTTTLYSSPTGIICHCVRFIMSEKDIQANKHHVGINELPEEILDLNPHQMLPTLFDREMVLYDFSVIAEYLDERFPFPPLMPVDPIERAQKRLLLFRFTRCKNSLFDLAERILNSNNKKDGMLARKTLTNYLLDLVPLFAYQPYFKSDTLTILDICMSALLWRLDKMNVELPDSARSINNYAQRLFNRKSFKRSLSNLEKEFRA